MCLAKLKTVSGLSVEMQDGTKSTPPGADEPGVTKPGRANSAERSKDQEELKTAKQLRAESAALDNEHEFDFYNRHYGVALKSADEDQNRQAETEQPKSESWHALKRLIRFQSTESIPDDIASYGSTGNTFEAQWFGRMSELQRNESESELSEPKEASAADEEVSTGNIVEETVRLKWTPMVDNIEDLEEEAKRFNSSVGSFAAAVERSKIATNKNPHVTAEPDRGLEDFAAAVEASKIKPALENRSDEASSDAQSAIQTDESMTCPSEPTHFANAVLSESAADPTNHAVPSEPTANAASTTVSAEPIAHAANTTVPGNTASPRVEPSMSLPPLESILPTASVARSILEDSEDVNPEEVAEARSKFGSLNAFERLQNRTKGLTPAGGESVITAKEFRDATANTPAWDVAPQATEAVLGQWCSQSSADIDVLPVEQQSPASPEDPSQPAPNAVHEAARESWLKAAAEYSTSVLKALKEQVKHFTKHQNESDVEKS